MARRNGKRMAPLRKAVDRDAQYALGDAVRMVKKNATARFDETIEISLGLGVDPRHADQMVRGMASLPHGTGKTVRVAVFATGAKADEARAAGADIVGAADLVEQVQGGKIDFDRCIATPDTMRLVGRLGRILGPRGLMPNPKLGTVAADVAGAIKAAKGGQVEFRVEPRRPDPRRRRQGQLRRRRAAGKHRGVRRRHKPREALRRQGNLSPARRAQLDDGGRRQTRDGGLDQPLKTRYCAPTICPRQQAPPPARRLNRRIRPAETEDRRTVRGPALGDSCNNRARAGRSRAAPAARTRGTRQWTEQARNGLSKRCGRRSRARAPSSLPITRESRPTRRPACGAPCAPPERRSASPRTASPNAPWKARLMRTWRNCSPDRPPSPGPTTTRSPPRRRLSPPARDNPHIVVLGGGLRATALDEAAVRNLASLPSLDELRARLVGVVSAPATRVAGALQAPAGQLARVFKAHADARAEAA